MEILKVSAISKSFGTLEVLKKISFSVNQGEVVAIIGPSGSGKSTLLRCITHLELVDNGTITLTGKDLVTNGVYAHADHQREICLKVGLVFQNFNLFPHFSVTRNITEAQVHVLRKKRTRRNNTPARFWKKWDFPTRRTITPVNYPAANSSVFLSRAPWPLTRKFFFLMSRQAPLTRNLPATYSALSGTWPRKK
jgi:polar amino acid transport system ATP-binding protein